MLGVIFIVEGDADILPSIARGAFDKTIEPQSDGRFLIESGAKHAWLERKPDDLLYEKDELAAIEDIVQGRAWDFWFLETSYPSLETLIVRSVLQSGLILAADNDTGTILEASRFARLVETCDRWYVFDGEPGEI